MAQVRKFDKGTNSGGITVQPDLFEWEGVGSYERKPMVQTLTKNLATYADHLGLSGDRRTRFLNNGAAAIKALESGKLRKLANGAYEDSSDLGMASTGKYDKNWIGKLKDTDNNAYNDIAGYFDAYMNKASVYDPDKAKKEAEEKAKKDKVKFGGDTFLRLQLASGPFGGTFSEDTWFNHMTAAERNKAIADIFNNAKYEDIYGKYLWDDTGIDSAETLRLRGQAFAQAISSADDYDNLDYTTAAALGISNLKGLLEKQEETPADILAAEKKKFFDEKRLEGFEDADIELLWANELSAAARRRQATIAASNEAEALRQLDDEWEAWYSLHNNPSTPYGPAVIWDRKGGDDKGLAAITKLIDDSGKARSEVYTRNITNALLGKTRYGEGVNAGQLISRWLNHAFNNDRGFFLDLKNGEYMIRGTDNPDDYSMWVYNPGAGSYRKVNALADKVYKGLAREIWDFNRTRSHKSGGTLKLQEGGYAAYRRSLQQGYDGDAQYFAEKAARLKEAKDKEEAKKKSDGSLRDTTRSGDQTAAGKRLIGTPNSDYEWTTADKVRLGTIGMDVLSAVTSLAPGYGTAASAGLGVLSTVGNLGADIADDSVSGFQAASNAVIGLGMDAIGLIPGVGVGAKAGKIARMIKPISKGLVWTLRGIGTYLAYNSIDAITKLMTNPDGMTVDDWRDVAGGIQAVMGLANYRSGKRTVKRNTTEKRVVDILGADRKLYTISQTDYEKLKSALGKEALDKLFKELTGSEEGLAREIKDNKKIPGLGWSIPGTGSNPGRTKTQLEWLDTPEAPVWAGLSGYNKGDKAYVDFFKKSNSPSGPATRPSNRLATSSQTPLKRTAKALAVGNTRVKRGLNTIREKELTPAEIKQINYNRRLAGKAPLTLDEIARINARAANNAQVESLTLKLRAQNNPKVLERSLKNELSRARLELEEANIAAMHKHASVPALYTKRFQIVGGTPVLSPPRPNRTKMLPPGPVRITDPARMLPAPRRIKLVTESTPITALSINQQFGLVTPSGAIPMGPSRASRQADLEAVFGRSATAKKAAKTRAKNKAAKQADAPRRKAEFAERLKLRQEKKAKKSAADKDRRLRKKLESNLMNNLGRLRNGGVLIPKYEGGTTKTGVQRLTGNWYTNIGSTFIDDIIAGLNNKNFRWTDINTAANTHSRLRTNNPNTSNPTYNKDVEDYYKLINGTYGFINTNGISSGEKNGRYKTAKLVDTGDSEAKGWQPDGYFSGKGLDRSPFGYVGDYTDAEFEEALKKYNAAGYELYDTKDANKAYNIRPLIKPATINTETSKITPPSTVTSSRSSTTLTSKLGPTTVNNPVKKQSTITAGRTKELGQNAGTSLSLLPEDVLDISRMIMGLGANARAAAQQKAGMKPLITDTWENVVSPEWDYFAQRTGEDLAAKLASFAAKPRTANSQDLFAGELEANTRGSQFIAQGNQQASNRFYATDRLRQQESDAAKARRVENANANMGRMLSVDAAKHLIDAALTTAQYAQVLAPWIAGVANQYRQNRAILKQMDVSAYLKALLTQMLADYDAAKAAGNTAEMARISNKYKTDIENYNKLIYSSPWLIQRTVQSPTSGEYLWIDYAKQGGRLTAREREVILRAKDFNKRMLEDNKLFHKDIMESKREHNKLIAGMSNLTADLIKNGMKWK